MKEKRESGILLHISSLPSPYGIGDLGPGAYHFVDVIAKAKQHLWQILPLNPTDTVYGSSPYHSISTFAGNPLFISPELMHKDGLLEKAEINCPHKFSQKQVDYESVTEYKRRLLSIAYERFKNQTNKDTYIHFCDENAQWLQDFAMFVAFKAHFKNAIWTKWPQAIVNRKSEALRELRQEVREHIEFVKFQQFIFMQQWEALKSYCNKKGIRIIGDLPIYVEHDGADCWVNPQIFKLDDQKNPRVWSGVPPDYFSKTGQLWGNPVYDWDALKATNYEWWIRRLEHNLTLCDITRIDHFRGLVAYWEIPVGEKTAINGQWIPVPVDDFFNDLLNHFSQLPVIAEDLGIITDDVKAAMKRFGLPGMKVLLFAFNEDLKKHPYLPHNYVKKCIVYTGTHDNNTVQGWFENDATEKEKENLSQYIKGKPSSIDVHQRLIQLAMKSIADTVVIPLQDVLGLGQEARMNLPATVTGNWRWRVTAQQLRSSSLGTLRALTEQYKRTHKIESAYSRF
ncbi:4-alpha-glucanotransferase [Candidatus Omnitrophota bacterium]